MTDNNMNYLLGFFLFVLPTTVYCQGVDYCGSSPCVYGVCFNYVNTYRCECFGGYTNKNCDGDADDCSNNPCVNGICSIDVNPYSCTCNDGYTGTNCDVDINECASNPCQNEATCDDQVNGYSCTCLPGYDDGLCQTDVNECASNPCVNGFCNDKVNSYSCQCPAGYTDINCDMDIDECASNPCQNGATCHDYVNRYSCTCRPGYEGSLCQSDIDECASNPCQNGATCHDYVNRYSCTCRPGYEGSLCQTDIDECAGNPCQNEATCHDQVNGYSCTCRPGYEGSLCQTDIDECASNPCQNGATCHDYVNRYSCTCLPGYEGSLCQLDINECASNPCQNGVTCHDYVNGYSCTCLPGYEGSLCQTDINECVSNPCHNEATCNDQVNGYSCTCRPGYKGSLCQTDIDECASNPCQNGATCHDQVNRYSCTCRPGYEGSLCQTDINECASNPCQNGATCHDQVNRYSCTCRPGYEGSLCQTDINECASNPCQNGATCNDYVNRYSCTCRPGYAGSLCQADLGGECVSNPCVHGTCNDIVNSYSCQCQAGYTDTNCDVETDECASNPCQNGATCNDLVNQYTCTCVAGYESTHCEIETDECASNPCKNRATCNDLVNQYTCAFVPGYESTHCEIDTDECVSNPCQNGATCNDQVNQYACTCLPGYKDGHCQTDINECDASPCHTHATCTNIPGSYTCRCFTGFSGDGYSACKAVDCGPTPDVLDGNLRLINDTYTSFRATAHTVCIAGFISTVDVVTCTADGNWTPSPLCLRVDCGKTLPSLQNGDLALVDPESTLYEDEATVNCYIGYKSSVSTIGCLATATWDNNVGCTLKECEEPVEIENGYFSFTTLNYGGEVTYSCNIGYQLQGQQQFICQANEAWSGVPPVCQIASCPALEGIKNGQVDVTDGTNYRAIATYSCNEKFMLIGESTRQCGDSGTWIGTDPTCHLTVLPITKCEIEQDQVYNYTWNVQKIGQTSSKQCPDGFTGTVTRSCNKGGEWSKTKYSCIRKAVLDVQNKALTINTTSSSEDIADTLEELSNMAGISAENDSTGTAADLTQEELEVLVGTLDTVAGIIEKDQVTNEITHAFVEVVNKLIDEQNTDTWKNTQNGAVKVLSAVDAFTDTLSKQLATANETKTAISKTNIAVEVKKIETISDIVFPDQTEEDVYQEDWIKNTPSGVLLKSDNLQGNTSYIAKSSIYRKISEILPTYQGHSSSDNREINGPVLSFSLDPPLGTLDPPVLLTFQLAKEGLTSASCNFWKKSPNGIGTWSTDGCSAFSSDDTVTVCECNHLTNFAVLMSPFQAVDANSLPLRIVSIVGIAVSILGLIMTLGLHLWLWKYIRNDRVVILINLCIALLCSYVIFIGGVDRTERWEVCAAVAAMLQYSYLVVFFIMLAEGIEISASVVFIFSKKSRIKTLLILAWFVPGVIVGISLWVTKTKGYGNDDFCWLSIESGLIWTFVGPAVFIILFNVVCLIIVMRAMFKTQVVVQKKKIGKLMISVRSLCVLMPLMGVTWILGILHITSAFYWIQYMFAICNGLQGVFIFLIHCVFNRQIKRALAARKRRMSSTTFSSANKKSGPSKNSSAPKVSLEEINPSIIEDSGIGIQSKKEQFLQDGPESNTVIAPDTPSL